MKQAIAYYHLPGLFEFYELYRVFLPLFRARREYFYPWCRIGSIYGAPADCLWGGGRVGCGEQDPRAVLDLMAEYDISARLTFSNSLLRPEHLSDPKCNALGPAVCRVRRPQKRGHRPLGPAATLFTGGVPRPLFRLLHHQSAHRFPLPPAGAGPGRPFAMWCPTSA